MCLPFGAISMLSSSHHLGARSCGRNQFGPVCKPWQRSIKKFLAGSKSTSSVQRQAGPCIAEGAKLHARPDSTGTLILYSHMLCPFAERALLTLLFKIKFGLPGLVARGHKFDWLISFRQQREMKVTMCRGCLIKLSMSTVARIRYGS